jgi:hypothetical protein
MLIQQNADSQSQTVEAETLIGRSQSFLTGSPTNFRQNTSFSTPSRSGGSNASIIAAILIGFAFLALVVGGLGVYYFSREDRAPIANITNNANQTELGTAETNSETKSPAERMDNRKNVPLPATSADPKTNANVQIVASSSSVRRSEKGNFYFPNFAFDGNSATAWSEGTKGAGVGEWLQFNFNREVALKQIKIQPGYFKNDEVWRKNNRVARITIKFSDNTIRQFSFADEMKTQTIDVGRTRTGWVKITIDDYFPGASDAEDTLISEVSFVTEP